MDEQSDPQPSTTSCRSNSETLEIITAAETLVLLSRAARVSNSSSAAINHDTNRCNRNHNNKNNNVSTKKVTFRLQPRHCPAVHDEPPSKKLKKHDDVVQPDLKSSATCSYNFSDELDEFKLRTKMSKLRHNAIDGSSTSTTKRVIKKQPTVVNQGPAPPQDLPDNITSIIRRMGGTNVCLITQKRLTATDVNSHNNRLQIPLRQIANNTFLTDQEKHYLTEKDETNHLNSIETLLIDPALNRHRISMRRWVMCKKFSVTKSENYVLNKPWSEIVESNKLKECDLVQLWGFRVCEKLHLILLKLAG